MRRFAFTMFELVIVIVIIGILAVAAMPSFNTNPLRDAAEQVAEHIRYTQHLAMVDDKFDDTNATWWKERWQIRFRTAAGEIQYAVFSNKNQDLNINCNSTLCDEPAKNPLNGLPLFYVPSRPNDGMILSNYGITSVNVSCNTDDNFAYATRLGVIAFDNLGRPYRGIYDSTTPTQYLMTQPCNIVLTGNGGTATITVQPETGYVSVIY
ncbi:MAG: prepilin-type N-terminal cleavage/methylation domain-containing protein [Sulfuricurvum sp.]